MRTEIVLPWIPIRCASFLLFGPFGGRTSWGRKSPTFTDSAGYNFTALACGVVALVALGIAFWARPRRVVPALAAIVATGAFGLMAYVSGIYWMALSRGDALLEGIEVMPEQWTVYPASGPPYFATAALIDAVNALTLAVVWLRQPRSTWPIGVLPPSQESLDALPQGMDNAPQPHWSWHLRLTSRYHR